MVVSSCTGTQRKETLTNCVITPCMVMKTKEIPSCTGTPGQPPKCTLCHLVFMGLVISSGTYWMQFNNLDFMFRKEKSIANKNVER